MRRAPSENNGMLFPPPPEGFRYFRPKNSQGVLAKFCAECGSHLDAHAYQWLTGGHGTVRACPPSGPSQAGTGTQTPQNEQRSVLSQQQQQQQQQRPYGSHSLYKHEREVDTSLTSSVVGDKKTIGNVPAHHRVYMNAQQQHLEQQQQQQQNNSGGVYHGDFIARDANGLPAPIPHDDEDGVVSNNNNDEEEMFYQQQQQQHLTASQQRQLQQQQPGGDATAHFSRSYHHLYDEAYSTPIPFGTDADIANPPEVAPPKGRRHLHQMTEAERMESGDRAQRAQVTQGGMDNAYRPTRSANRARMEQSNLHGAGGINVTQDAVRPDATVVKTHIKTHRRDAESKILGAGGTWNG